MESDEDASLHLGDSTIASLEGILTNENKAHPLLHPLQPKTLQKSLELHTLVSSSAFSHWCLLCGAPGRTSLPWSARFHVPTSVKRRSLKNAMKVVRFMTSSYPAPNVAVPVETMVSRSLASMSMTDSLPLRYLFLHCGLGQKE